MIIVALLICEMIFFILFMIDYAKLEKKVDALKKENEVLKKENEKIKQEAKSWEKTAEVLLSINPESNEEIYFKAIREIWR